MEVIDAAPPAPPVAVAEGELKEASRRLAWQRRRLLLAKLPMPAWVSALGISSIAAFAVGMMAITFGGAFPTIVTSVVLTYAAVGGGAFWVARDEPGEDDMNRRALREQRVAEARAAMEEARSGVAKARAAEQARVVAERAAAGIDEMNRLLGVDPGRLYPDEFERFLCEVFRLRGYVATQTGQTGDQGVDLVAEKSGVRLAIQAKCYTSGVGNSAVQQVFAGMHHYQCHRCAVITSSTFSGAARELAASCKCMLIEGHQIPALIRGELSL